MKVKDRNNQAGTAAVEFAIILPILIILVLGIIEFSILIYNKAVITNASREGARAGMVADLSDEDRRIAAESAVSNYVSKYDSIFLCLDPGSQVLPTSVDLSKQGTTSEQRHISVKVDYEYAFFIMPNFISNLTDKVKIAANTEMQFEN